MRMERMDKRELLDFLTGQTEDGVNVNVEDDLIMSIRYGREDDFWVISSQSRLTYEEKADRLGALLMRQKERLASFLSARKVVVLCEMSTSHSLWMDELSEVDAFWDCFSEDTEKIWKMLTVSTTDFTLRVHTVVMGRATTRD